ncbi:DUF3631 domain-containing protein [Micromonospora inyonensis]|uniref:DUF3631 domain-containing protein n=1 Tax=Micromonospora inyonensis TaxID=47866 RepID=A0A1C6RDP6_9ACTN|nr:DUF3631 domain-containing protein [Micromonospora inyonensis]SCL15173.1 Protein of unknown function [Micromonospora inyonensis]
MNPPTNTTGQPHNGATILDALHDCLTKYVILPSPEAVDAVALWIAATHAQAAWAHAPRLVIRAPEKRCGKSRLLDVVEGCCHDPLITVNASPAAVYRAIGTGHPPTLLVDEADTIFGGKNADANEDLRGLLNAGHQRNRPAIRWDAGTQKLEKIPTFAMAALAGIGAMPDTIEDRAVVIRMRRRAPGETVAPYRHRRDGPALRAVAQQLAGWLGANLATLEAAEPPMPVEDRAADTWEPLVAVADLAGGTWPARARHAVTILTAEADESANVSTRIRLLADIRTAFTALGDPPAVATTQLLKVLNDDDEAPWAGSGPAGLTGKKLGDLLREFGITSGNVRFPVGQAKGYTRDAFTDAWTRYCPPPTAPPTVPSVPTSFPQVSPGTHCTPGTDQTVPATRTDTAPGTDRSVPAHQSVPALSRKNELGTDGTDTPAQPAIRQLSATGRKP